jgi:plastocyanin
VQVCALAQGAAAFAADLTVVVNDANGAPVADAVITLAPAAASIEATPSATSTTVIDQQNESFGSLVSLIKPGDRVRFRNSDGFLHHVYSFARINPFDLHVRAEETSAETRYDKVGIAAIGCNVHDNMLTYVYVTDLPFAAKTDETGAARIVNAPEGYAALSVWHPRAKTRNQEIVSTISISSAPQEFEVTLALRPERRQSSRY